MSVIDEFVAEAMQNALENGHDMSTMRAVDIATDLRDYYHGTDELRCTYEELVAACQKWLDAPPL